ncbi:HAD family hydrolase [Atopobiaceae bacterium 24-176]
MPQPSMARVYIDTRIKTHARGPCGTSYSEAVTPLPPLREAADWFDALVFAEDIGHPKPAPDVFATAAKRLGVPPENSLMVEDSEAVIEAAHAAGTLSPESR